MNFNKPRRRSFEDWMRDLETLAGKRDVSGDDAAIQAAFADDPQYANDYAAAECADGLARERNPREISE